MTLQLPKIGADEDRKLYDEAMKRGYVESALPLVLFVGVTGSGKTLFKRLLLGQSVPELSPPPNLLSQQLEQQATKIGRLWVQRK